MKQCDSGGYILPDFSRSSTFHLQKQVLQILHEHIVVAFKLHLEENSRIRLIITSFNNERLSSQNLLVDSHHISSNAEHNIQRVESHHSSSNAEQTIQTYPASATLLTSKPLVTKPDDPCNGYVSKWQDCFNSCLACSSTKHRFVSCPKTDNIDDLKIWQEL